MTDFGRSDYPQEDHERLMEAAAAVLLATVAADRSGPVAYFQEMTAAGTFLYEARTRYRENSLVQELYRRQEEGEQEAAKVEESERIDEDYLLAQVDLVDDLLRRDEEGMEFRRFLFELAEKVARASRTRPFGPRVSSEEAEFLTKLRTRLGLEET